MPRVGSAGVIGRLARTFAQLLLRPYSVRRNVTLGRRVHLGVGTTLWAPSRLTVGDDVYIGKRCTIECDGSIGSGVLIANHVGLVGRWDHDVRTVGVPARQAPWVGDPERAMHPGRDLAVTLADDVWIGYGAIILSGVTIGRGAVIGAGAVLTHDVAPYQVVAGNPARVIGKRFTPSQIGEHEDRLADRE
jgi:acetyltransferase-like isoleucine patch superfamily enzyme